MKSFRAKPVGWRYESQRHMLAAKGVKTSIKTPQVHRKLMSPDEREWRKVVRQLDDKTRRVRVRHYGDAQEFNPVFEESKGEFEHLDDLKKRLANERFDNRSTESERNAIENIYDKYFGGTNKRRYEVRKYPQSRVIGRHSSGTLAGTLANIYAGNERKVTREARTAGYGLQQEARAKKELAYTHLTPSEEKLRDERIALALSKGNLQGEYVLERRNWRDASEQYGPMIEQLVSAYKDVSGKLKGEDARGENAEREKIRTEIKKKMNKLLPVYEQATHRLEYFMMPGGYEVDSDVLVKARKIAQGKKK
jgi:hypothetical protein